VVVTAFSIVGASRTKVEASACHDQTGKARFDSWDCLDDRPATKLIYTRRDGTGLVVALPNVAGYAD